MKQKKREAYFFRTNLIDHVEETPSGERGAGKRGLVVVDRVAIVRHFDELLVRLGLERPYRLDVLGLVTILELLVVRTPRLDARAAFEQFLVF